MGGGHVTHHAAPAVHHAVHAAPVIAHHAPVAHHAVHHAPVAHHAVHHAVHHAAPVYHKPHYGYEQPKHNCSFKMLLRLLKFAPQLLRLSATPLSLPSRSLLTKSSATQSPVLFVPRALRI